MFKIHDFNYYELIMIAITTIFAQKINFIITFI